MLHASLNVFDEAIDALIKREEPTGAVVFYGSSTIAIWGHERLKAQMKDITAVNRGFGGSTAEQALYYYDRALKPLAPRAIVWYEGDNDIPCGYTPEETFFLTERVFAWLQKDFPAVKIFILPTKDCPARAPYAEKTAAYRALLKEYADSRDNVTYIDYLHILRDANNTLRDEIFEADRLHFNAKGYDELSETVYNALKAGL